MAIPKFEDDLRIISKLGDNPGTDNGYTTQEFKEAFDKAPLLIQKFINEVLIPAANASSSPEEGLSMKGPINMNGQKLSGIGAPTADGDAVNWGSVKDLGKAKAGFIYPLAAAVVPEGFLLCDGAAYERSEYPELFAAIGTMYGSGDGATTFNVPDLRNRVPAGSSENHHAGEMVGEETHQTTLAETASHKHATAGYHAGEDVGYPVLNADKGHLNASYWNFQSGDYATTYSEEVGGNQPHNNMQPTTYIHGYIIATGKGTGVSVADIIMGAQALPLGLEYGGVGATDPKTARENLGITPENIGALSMELLWENASPDSEFAGQTLPMDMSGWDGFIIQTSENSVFVANEIGQTGKDEVVLTGVARSGADGSPTLGYRAFKCVAEGISITNFFTANWATINNRGNRPQYIYGIKGVSA